jgi:hypothetical protein
MWSCIDLMNDVKVLLINLLLKDVITSLSWFFLLYQLLNTLSPIDTWKKIR